MFRGNTGTIENSSNRSREVAHITKRDYKFRSAGRYDVKRKSCLDSEWFEMGRRVEVRGWKGREGKTTNHKAVITGKSQDSNSSHPHFEVFDSFYYVFSVYGATNPYL
jgi:hypothetical protein